MTPTFIRTENRFEDYGEKIGGSKKDSFLDKKGFTSSFFSSGSEALSYFSEPEKDIYINKSNIFPFRKDLYLNNGLVDASSIKYMQAVRALISNSPTIPLSVKKDPLLLNEAYSLYIYFLHEIDELFISLSKQCKDFRQTQSHIDGHLKDLLFCFEDGADEIAYSDMGMMLKGIGCFTDSLFNRVFNKKEEVIDFLSATWDNKKGDNKTKSPAPSVKNQLKGLAHLDTIRRTGICYRINDDVIAPDIFAEAFGFKGIEFGIWLSQREREEVLKLNYDALADLSHILKCNPMDISFGGRLSVSLGSRGNSSASAHYEPEKIVITLTKKKGAGSLAHEWFHALDNFLGSFNFSENIETNKIEMDITNSLDYSTMPSQFAISERERESFSTHQEAIYRAKEKMAVLGLALKYQNLPNDDELKRLIARHSENEHYIAHGDRQQKKEALKDMQTLENTYGATKFYFDAIKLDGKMGKYYSKGVELAARAFEGFVLSELSKKEYRNDYLVSSTKSSIIVNIDDCAVSPYPTDEMDIEIFSELFTDIFKIIYPENNQKMLEDILILSSIESDKNMEDSSRIKDILSQKRDDNIESEEKNEPKTQLIMSF